MDTFNTFFPIENRVHEVIHPVNKSIIQQKTRTLEQLHQLNKDGYNMYFAVQGYSNNTRSTENLTELRSWFVDLDLEIPKDDFRPLLKDIITNDKPSMIIETGKGFHIYWFLDEIIEKENNPNWDSQVAEFYRIENFIVENKYNLKPYCSDQGAKDKARLMRMPGSLYYKGSTESSYTTEIIYENNANTYSIAEITDLFNVPENTIIKTKVYDKMDSDDFSIKMNELYPIISRPSYIAMSQCEGVTPGMRNETLSVFAGISLYAGVPQRELTNQVIASTWLGLDKREIETIIHSAYSKGYNRFKHPWYQSLITPEEELKTREAIATVRKIKKETDRVRYDTYERELFKKYPNLKLGTNSDTVFNYKDGYYYELPREELLQMIFRSMDEDNLATFRTNSLVANKEKALKSILPLFIETEDDEKINCTNGVFDIKTMSLSEHSPDNMTLTQNNTAYNPTSECPVWIEKVSDMLDNDQDKIKNIQMFGGYCLTKSTKFHKMLVMIGEGRNGKGVIMEILKNIIGERNSSSISIKRINDKFTLSRLIGKQVNFFDETPSRQYLETDTLKSLVAGGRFDVERKGIDSFEAQLYSKCIFMVNSFPKFDDLSDGTVERLITVKFNNSYGDDNPKRDPDLVKKLIAERDGIFNWFVQGAIELFNERKGFITTDEHREQIEEIKQDSNAIRRWAHEYVSIRSFTDEELKIEETEKGIYQKVHADDLFDDFIEYANKYNKYASNTQKPLFTRHLNKIVKEQKGFIGIIRTSQKNITYYKGIIVESVVSTNILPGRAIKSNYVK